ncbi:MAG: hypothetical protein JWM02_1314 [Frankiales bacterium]|nr:hypothetical protein [Frankiales bacterium]
MTSPPAGQRRSVPSEPEPVVHQVLHGYDQGHRMLAGSRVLHDEDLRLIDRLSDASGQRPSPGNDGYLTGYPLPSGEAYALARTWYMGAAPRPNVVWTHTLLVPPVMMRRPSLAGLAALLRHPDHTDREQFRAPLAVPPPPVSIGTDPDLAADLAAVIARLYGRSPKEVWFAADLVDRRNDLCLALWDQQWPRLRSAFAFCAGALEARQLADRPFDLLCGPGGAAVPAGPDSSQDEIPSEVVRVLVADLIDPGPLREYLRVVGPDSSRRRIMTLFVETYLQAVADNPPNASATLQRLARRAPRPTSMRQLKRHLLTPTDGLLSAAPATAVLRSVLSPAVAGHVLAVDAALAGWAARAWQEDPEVVLTSLLTATADPAVPALASVGTGKPTVAQVAPNVLVELVAQQAMPLHLGRIAERNVSLAVDLLHHHVSDPAWWSEWARLPEVSFETLLVEGSLARTAAELRPATAALVRVPEGVPRWRSVREVSGAEAVRELLHALAAQAPTTAWTAAISERPDLLAKALTGPRTAKEVAVAADAAPDAQFASDQGMTAWRALAARRTLWSSVPRRAAVLFAAALADSGDLADTTFAGTYQVLYETFAVGADDDAWDFLEPLLPSKHDDWDRCRRLARVTARAIGGKQRAPRPAMIHLIPEGPARDAVLEELKPKEDKHDRSASSAQKGPVPHPLETILKSIWPW